MQTKPKKRYPVIWGMDNYVLGYATTAAGALKVMRKVSPSAVSMKLNRAKKRAWVANYQ